MNIVIVGGGTAGWLTALSLHKKHDVTLIESEIPTIGVGESTTDTVIRWLKQRVDMKEFHAKTNSTFKLGVQFDNWVNKNETYYHLFGDVEDKVPNGKFNQVVRYCFQNGINLDNLSIFDKCREEDMTWDSVATHWDSVAVPAYLRQKLEHKILIVNDTVKKVHYENESITKLQLMNGTVEADLYIDCTGFHRVLTKSTNNKWIDWNAKGQVDRALVWQMPHKDSIPTFTQAEAWDYGWRWKIPTTDRLGNGYVFDSDFISVEDAEKEIRKRVDYKGPVRLIEFNPGRIEQVYYKNIVSLGLSSHFLEPLEATNFDFLVYNLQNLDLVIEDKINIEQFNNNANRLAESIREFVKMHYINNTNDTAFWKAQNKNLCGNAIKVIENAETTNDLAPGGLFTDYNWYKVAQGVGIKSKSKNDDAELLALFQLASI